MSAASRGGNAVLWKAGYRLLLWLSFPLLLLRLWRRGRAEPGYREAIGQRFGWYGQVAPHSDQPLLWLHAVSVGETRAAQPLVAALARQYPHHRWLITHMTATGRDTARQLYGDMPGVSFAWLPYDYPSAMRRFLRFFRPALGVVMETEIWPGLLAQCRRAAVPVLLANARLSERSERGYARIAPLARAALGDFAAIAAQGADDARRLIELGAKPATTTVTGNLKFDAPVEDGSATPGCSPRERGTTLRERSTTFGARIGARKVLLAASTREGEEELLLAALQQRPLPDGALLLIVPRHPQRFDEVASQLGPRGLRYARRSDPEGAWDNCEVLLGDSMGEMPDYYRAADCAFIGGSLLPLGGQNLIEACALGVPVLIGPHTFNFAQAAEEAVAAGAARRVADAAGVMQAAAELLRDEAARLRMSEAGLAFVAAHRGATARTVAICQRLLENPG